MPSWVVGALGAVSVVLMALEGGYWSAEAEARTGSQPWGYYAGSPWSSCWELTPVVWVAAVWVPQGHFLRQP